MRLLNITTFKFQEFFEKDRPQYIIASHRWHSTEQESTYKDVVKGRKKESTGYKKIQGFCTFVHRLNKNIDRKPIEWLWIDTCCIDKRNFTDLTEAINSMYKWHEDAYCCLALLHDVELDTERRDSSNTPGTHSSKGDYNAAPKEMSEADLAQLKSSVWFKRGWTLQELIAPKTVILLGHEWQVLGRKGHAAIDIAAFVQRDLTAVISKFTGIPDAVLYDAEERHQASFEERLAWVKGRDTSRPEDMAYCMLGIMGVFMSLIYGERERALERLVKAVHDEQLRIKTKRELDSGSDPTDSPPHNHLRVTNYAYMVVYDSQDEDQFRCPDEVAFGSPEPGVAAEWISSRSTGGLENTKDSVARAHDTVNPDSQLPLAYRGYYSPNGGSVTVPDTRPVGGTLTADGTGTNTSLRNLSADITAPYRGGSFPDSENEVDRQDQAVWARRLFERISRRWRSCRNSIASYGRKDTSSRDGLEYQDAMRKVQLLLRNPVSGSRMAPSSGSAFRHHRV